MQRHPIIQSDKVMSKDRSRGSEGRALRSRASEGRACRSRDCEGRAYRSRGFEKRVAAAW